MDVKRALVWVERVPETFFKSSQAAGVDGTEVVNIKRARVRVEQLPETFSKSVQAATRKPVSVAAREA